MYLKSAIAAGILVLSHSAVAGDKPMVLNLIGTGAMYEATVPDIDGDGVEDPAICFDSGLVDLRKNKTIGTATDCLSNITADANGNIALVGTTYFNTKKGTLISRGNTSVLPVQHPTTTTDGVTVTHITGGANGFANAIVGGTGDFADAVGTSRLSGMVNMTDFGGEVGDPITFDCLFVINLD